MLKVACFAGITCRIWWCRPPCGPITVMVLVHDSVAEARPFDEGGYRGVIVPVPGHGSLAVLAKGGQENLGEIESVAARVKDAIVWTG